MCQLVRYRTARPSEQRHSGNESPLARGRTRKITRGAHDVTEASQTLVSRTRPTSLLGFCPVEKAVAALSQSGVEARGAVFTKSEVVDFILDLVGYTASSLWLIHVPCRFKKENVPGVAGLVRPMWRQKLRQSEHTNHDQDTQRFLERPLGNRLRQGRKEPTLERVRGLETVIEADPTAASGMARSVATG